MDSSDQYPVTRFRKDVLRVGTFRHPTKGWTLHVTPERLDKYAKAFQRMTDNGVAVPFVKDHEVSTEATYGRIIGLERDEDRLIATIEARGEKAIEATKRVGLVSVNIEHAIDGSGRKYGEAITHVSLTPTPVVSGQGEMKIAASMNGPEPFVLSRGDSEGLPDVDAIIADVVRRCPGRFSGGASK